MPRIGHEAPDFDNDRTPFGRPAEPDKPGQLRIGETPAEPVPEPETPPGLRLTPEQERKVRQRMETDGVSRLDAIRQRLPRSVIERHAGYHNSQVAAGIVKQNIEAREQREAEPTSDVESLVDLMKETKPKPADQPVDQDHQAA